MPPYERQHLTPLFANLAGGTPVPVGEALLVFGESAPAGPEWVHNSGIAA